MLAGLRRAVGAPQRLSGDVGLTLIELMVSMAIMSIVMVVFTTGVLSMFRTVNKSDSNTVAQSQLSMAFRRLDKEIRYASEISLEGQFGGDPYVEFLTESTVPSTSTTPPTCTGLRLHATRLERRTWPRGTTPSAANWVPLASGVSSTHPFTTIAADSTLSWRQLQLNLTATAGSGKTATSRQTVTSFTALNATLATYSEEDSDTVCSEGRAP